MKSVTVFCSSSHLVSPMFFSEMELMTEALVKKGIQLVYGGACVGLMGHMANTALKLGGKVLGVIPEYLNQPGIVHPNLSELIVVGTLLDRKRKMIEASEGVIAFPGGIGTIDELSEALALKQLGEIQHPVYLHNFLDFWTPFIDYMDQLREQKMISQDLKDLFTVVSGTEDLMSRL